MTSRNQKKALTRAREREACTDLDGAVQAYLAADAPLEAAAVFAKRARHEQAGELLLSTLGVAPEEANTLDTAGRKRARMAASYLARSDDPSVAVALFVALGERIRAAELLERSGDLVNAQRLRDGASFRESGGGPRSEPAGAAQQSTSTRERAHALEREGKLDVAARIYMQLKLHGDAGRVLVAMGQIASAAEMFEKAKMPYEAAACHLRSDNSEQGLMQLVRVQREDPRYRKAANHAIQLAAQQDSLSFQVEHFLGELIATGPVGDEEHRSFLTLADLYAKEGLFENARQTVRRVLAGHPDDPEALRRLQQIEASSSRGSDVYRKISAQDSGFTGDKRPHEGLDAPSEVLPGLPALPAPPSLPRVSTDFAPGPMTGPAAAATQISARTQLGAAGGFPLIPPLPDVTVQPAEPGPTSSVGASVAQPPQPAAGTPSTPSAPKSSADPFEVGGIVDQRYRIDKRLGVGGSAIVFQAYDQELDETIALKVFLAEIPDPELQAQGLARFKLELKLNRQLVHGNILRLYDIGMYRGRRYISMELLVGRCLDEILEGPLLPVEQSIAYLVQACRGLHMAHQRNVIHRDIKPENLFVTDDDLVKVMDFGIAKKSGGANLTKTGMMAGTPRYMSPEQINDFSAVGPRADLYSLGVVAYHMFSGKVPFDHDELMPLLMMHINEQPRPMRELRPELPAELDEIVLQLLEKEPSKRPASCNELARTLQRLGARFR